jgi:hypothetical protein
MTAVDYSRLIQRVYGTSWLAGLTGTYKRMSMQDEHHLNQHEWELFARIIHGINGCPIQLDVRISNHSRLSAQLMFRMWLPSSDCESHSSYGHGVKGMLQGEQRAHTSSSLIIRVLCKAFTFVASIRDRATLGSESLSLNLSRALRLRE